MAGMQDWQQAYENFSVTSDAKGMHHAALWFQGPDGFKISKFYFSSHHIKFLIHA
jgi:hypothetical protein